MCNHFEVIAVIIVFCREYFSASLFVQSIERRVLQCQFANPRRTPKYCICCRRQVFEWIEHNTKDGVMRMPKSARKLIAELLAPRWEVPRFDVVYLETVIGEDHDKDIWVVGIEGKYMHWLGERRKSVMVLKTYFFEKAVEETMHNSTHLHRVKVKDMSPETIICCCQPLPIGTNGDLKDVDCGRLAELFVIMTGFHSSLSHHSVTYATGRLLYDTVTDHRVPQAVMLEASQDTRLFARKVDNKDMRRH